MMEQKLMEQKFLVMQVNILLQQVSMTKNYNLIGTNTAEFVVKGADAGLKVKEVNDKKIWRSRI